MSRSSPDNLKLYELFVRYWDHSLSQEEMDELHARLVADPEARDGFHAFTVQAVAAAEMPSAASSRIPEPSQPEPEPKSGWSRRRVLQFCGGGLAAGVAGIALGRWMWHDPAGSVRVTATRGSVAVRGADGNLLPEKAVIPNGSTVSTFGQMSSAILAYPDGSTVLLIGDSSVTIYDGGLRLQLHQGTASADVRPRSIDAQKLVLTTPLLTLSAVSGALLTLGQGVRATEVEVQQGRVSVSAPSGEPMGVVREGELLTVGQNGDMRRQPAPLTDAEFTLDLTQPLPDGWVVGDQARTANGCVLRPRLWPDPYYKDTPMYQIRSDHRWSRGFFKLSNDSVIHVKYRAERAKADGQMCFCVRTEQTHRSDTGMLEYNDGFQATGGDFRWLHVRAGDMLNNNNAPKFRPPFFGFLIIFNTYTEDTGLEIAEFRVSLPGRKFNE